MLLSYPFATGVAIGATIAFLVFLIGYFIALLELKIERVKYTNSRPRRYK